MREPSSYETLSLEDLRLAIHVLHERVEKRHVEAYALVELVKRNAPEVQANLLRALSSKDSYLRSVAARHLEKFPSEETIDGLIKALKDRNGDVREYAIESLRKMNAKQAGQPLLELLNREKKKFNRVCIVEALEDLDVVEAIPDLIEAFQKRDPNPLMRDFVTGALAFLSYDRPESEQIRVLLLEAFEKERSRRTRLAIAEGLVKLGESQFLKVIYRGLNSKQPFLRCRAGSALYHIVNQSTREQIIQQREKSLAREELESVKQDNSCKLAEIKTLDLEDEED